jgi:hypothetical protein
LRLLWPERKVALRGGALTLDFSLASGLEGSIAADEIYFRRAKARLEPTEFQLRPPKGGWDKAPARIEIGQYLELPLAVGLVGGAIKTHPVARVSVKLLRIKTAQELAQVFAAVGLAQNFAALRALATEGIQKGHMKLHAKNVAVAGGATGKQIDEIAQQLVREGNIRQARAEELVKAYGTKKSA